MTDRELRPLIYLGALFAATLTAANLIAGKIVVVAGLYVPAGILAYSITFPITDTICEIWGRRRAQVVVNAGFGVLVLVWVLVQIAILLPAAPFWQGQHAYADVLGTANRIIVASLIAYAVSQTMDVWLFNRIREMTSARMLWLRNNVSTLVAQTFDTVLFVTIAFYGQFPVLPVIVGQLVIKYVIALLDTPVVYALVILLRRRLGRDRVPEAV